MLRPLLHSTAVVVNTYTIVYDQLFMELPFPAERYKNLPLRARLAFVTFWCLYLQTLYFSLSLINDFFGTNEASPKRRPLIRRIRDHLFSLAFPVGLFVSITFWSVYFYRKELVFPDYVAKAVPFWGNMVLHVTNSVFISLDILVSKITYPSRIVGLGLAMSFNVLYLICLISLRVYTGAFIYPFLEILDAQSLVIFFIVSAVVGLLLYFLGETLCSVSNVSQLQVNGYHGTPKKKL